VDGLPAHRRMVTNPCALPGLPGAWSCPFADLARQPGPARCRDRRVPGPRGRRAPRPPAPCERGPDDALAGSSRWSITPYPTSRRCYNRSGRQSPMHPIAVDAHACAGARADRCADGVCGNFVRMIHADDTCGCRATVVAASWHVPALAACPPSRASNPPRGRRQPLPLSAWQPTLRARPMCRQAPANSTLPMN
jgi:hypothetical protein